jgi:hypothetical protein
MGAWILANQATRRGSPSPLNGFGIALGLGVVTAILAVLVGFPGARWSLATFAVAFLPGLVLATIVSALGTRRA